MKLKNISLKWQMQVLCMILLFIPMFLFSIVNYAVLKDETMSQLQDSLKMEAESGYNTIESAWALSLEMLKSSMSTARIAIFTGINTEKNISVKAGTEKTITVSDQLTLDETDIQLPDFLINDKPLYMDTSYVDKLRDQAGLIVSIFQCIPEGLLRISTAILNKDGSRAVNTYIPSGTPIHDTIMNNTLLWPRFHHE